jgi:hypothetical protein
MRPRQPPALRIDLSGSGEDPEQNRGDFCRGQHGLVLMRHFASNRSMFEKLTV